MNIKGREIGTGRPMVCVPIVEQKREAICRRAQELAEQPVEMIEWRIDWYENSDSAEDVCKVTEELAEILGDKILLCTFRSKLQGGEKEITAGAYVKLLQSIAEHGKADVLDVEIYELEKTEELIADLHKSGVAVIGSEHNFEKTPFTDKMVEKILFMKKVGADVAKLAVMPQNYYDVLNIMTATRRVKDMYPDYPLITMSMGKMGTISRIAGQAFGSCVTFAALGKTSAPGQLPVEDMVMILDKISNSMGE